jgi:hypothetical protein
VWGDVWSRQKTYVESVWAIFVGGYGRLVDEIAAFGFVCRVFLPAKRAFKEDLSESLIVC